MRRLRKIFNTKKGKTMTGTTEQQLIEEMTKLNLELKDVKSKYELKSEACTEIKDAGGGFRDAAIELQKLVNELNQKLNEEKRESERLSKILRRTFLDNETYKRALKAAIEDSFKPESGL